MEGYRQGYSLRLSRDRIKEDARREEGGRGSGQWLLVMASNDNMESLNT